MLGEFQPVGAGHRHVSVLQGPDHGVEDGVAAAHEDQHVAGQDAAPTPMFAILDTLVRVRGQHGVDAIGDAARQRHGRRLRIELVERQAPIDRIGLRRRAHQRPEFDETRGAAAQGFMGRRPQARLGKADRVIAGREDPIHGFQHGARRAERQVEGHGLEARIATRRGLAKGRALDGELGRLGTLERVDRLLLVAHREDRAHA